MLGEFLISALIVAGAYVVYHVYDQRTRARAANPCRYGEHPWPRWSEPKQGSYTLHVRANPGEFLHTRGPLPQATFWSQERTCPVCGRYERRLLDESGDER